MLKNGTSFFIEAKLGYLSEGFKKHLEKRKLEWITRGKTAILEKKEKQEKKQVKIVTIKDRMQEQITDLLGDFEAYLDDFISGDKTVKDFDPYKMMLSYQPAVKANHAKLIAESYECAKAEAKEVVDATKKVVKEAKDVVDAAKGSAPKKTRKPAAKKPTTKRAPKK